MRHEGARIKNLMVVSLMAVAMSLGGVSPAAADHHGKDERKGKKCEKYGDKKKCSEKKLYKKIRFAMKKQDKIGLSDEQVETLKNLRTDLKKKVIEHNAAVDTVTVDIRAGLRERHVDVEAVQALVDQKYEAKKGKANDLVVALAEFKNTLTDEQFDEMKAAWKDKKADKKGWKHKKDKKKKRS